jgi:hypothetical protein
MKRVFIETFRYTSYPVQCVCVDGGEPWFRGDHVARILGYANIAKALFELDDDDTKTLGELLASSNTDLFISVYGLLCLVHACKKPDAKAFRRWVWSDIISVIRRIIPPDHCSYDDDDDEDIIDGDDDDVDSVESTQGLKDEEEPWHDFSTNRNPKYWLRKFNKTALMKECDKRGVIIDKPMMTLNVKIIQALIAADTI